MSFFPHASNFVITNPVFVENHLERHGRGVEYLYNASRMQAAHDSAPNEFAAESLPRTRHGSIIEDLSTWAQLSSPSFSSLWVVGPESNLAHICADRLGDYLAASFFFSRELGVEDPTQFFPTISYQLATHFPAYKALIDTKLHQSPGLLSKSLKTQFRELIVQPFEQLRTRGEASVGLQQIIIVNGLEECKGDRARQELLRILTTETEPLPFRWVVFTRPDIAVDGQRLGLKSTPLLNLDVWRLSLGEGYRRHGDTRVCMLRLEGDGIWIVLFGSMHKLAHWAVLFFFYLPAESRLRNRDPRHRNAV
ncbi:hypothetical protein D9756_004444 [Leucocoprinus leucothites]|uniref:Nephrocystin 3-like N-terminal domain-containing protein n=1 Tax=Leucocoprinus leucothites TaxID=201217 RepID=A0A8H5G9T7_9AGAR|nr:hypothetical protein D9756_004444 [Leucoagaricus leucothites]